MERTQILDLMGTLKLYGMRSAYDEVMAAGIKRQHEPPRIVGDLLQSEIAEKQARSIRYQMTIAKLPLAKDIDDFGFADTPINQALVHDLATGDFVANQRNVVLIGGTGTGKSHLAIAIATDANWDELTADLKKGTSTAHVQSVCDGIKRMSHRCNLDRKHMIKTYANHVIRRHPELVTHELLTHLENVMHYEFDRNIYQNKLILC
jgi:hypothetical protein